MSFDLKIIEQQKSFITLNLEKNLQAISDYLLSCELYRAKNTEGSKTRALLAGLANEVIRFENQIQLLADDYYIWTCTSLIEAWEKAVGIPDDCLSQNVDIETRRKQVIAKLALMNIQTRQDFIDLAAFFGFEITIENGSLYSTFPLQFPILFTGTSKEAYFTMIITFIDVPPPPELFPLKFPIKFGGSDPTAFLRCLFGKLKPAQCMIVYRYQ